VVADIDGDDLNEVLVVTSFGLLHAFDAAGGNAPGYPRKYSGGGAIAPLLADVDRQGRQRRTLLFFEALGDTLESPRRSRSARLNVADLAEAPSRSPRPAEWWGLGGGAQRLFRGRRGAPSTNTGPVEQLRAQRPLVYPNPAGSDGDLVFVRYYSAAEQTAQLRVFTLEGEEIFETSAQSRAGQTAEMVWSSRGLAPGPYLCRLDYVGAQGADTALMTLYIER
jgi:hypothetical protein